MSDQRFLVTKAVEHKLNTTHCSFDFYTQVLVSRVIFCSDVVIGTSGATGGSVSGGDRRSLMGEHVIDMPADEKTPIVSTTSLNNVLLKELKG